MRVVVAAGLLGLLGDRQPAELAAPDHQRLVEQPALVQIGEQAGDGLVGLAGELLVISLDVDVSIPGELVLHAARVDLHEPDAALDQPPGHQALAGDVVAPRVVEAVQLLDVGRLAIDVDRLGRGRLHPVGQLEALDPRGQLRLGGKLLVMKLVQAAASSRAGPAARRRSSPRRARGCRSARPWGAGACPGRRPAETPRPSSPRGPWAARGPAGRSSRRSRAGPAISLPRP